MHLLSPFLINFRLSKLRILSHFLLLYHILIIILVKLHILKLFFSTQNLLFAVCILLWWRIIFKGELTTFVGRFDDTFFTNRGGIQLGIFSARLTHWFGLTTWFVVGTLTCTIVNEPSNSIIRLDLFEVYERSASIH